MRRTCPSLLSLRSDCEATRRATARGAMEYERRKVVRWGIVVLTSMLLVVLVALCVAAFAQEGEIWVSWDEIEHPHLIGYQVYITDDPAVLQGCPGTSCDAQFELVPADATLGPPEACTSPTAPAGCMRRGHALVGLDCRTWFVAVTAVAEWEGFGVESARLSNMVSGPPTVPWDGDSPFASGRAPCSIVVPVPTVEGIRRDDAIIAE